MVNILSIVGTRPQFIKLSPLCHEINKHDNLCHVIVHTGQHFSNNMSDDIFNILNIPDPNYHLNINNLNHGEMTGNMLIQLEKILIIEKPKYVLIYGDCNTTLAGALAAKKLNIITVHIEAGLRSYNKNMPEEINRITVDHISDYLLCPNINAKNTLIKEGISNNIYITGNLQIDLLKNAINNYHNLDILKHNNLSDYVLLTIHRHYNTEINRLKFIISQLAKINHIIFFPIHPRTRNIMNNINLPDNIILHDPVNYLDMTILERHANYIITDSGGIQPEAWYLGVKCIIIRPETEWIETLENNNNILYNFDQDINLFIDNFMKKTIHKIDYNYNCSDNIIKLLT